MADTLVATRSCTVSSVAYCFAHFFCVCKSFCRSKVSSEVDDITWEEQVPYLPAVVRPGAELQLALLIVERKPRDVDLAGGLEDAGRHIQATAVTSHYDIGVVCAVELFVGTGTKTSRRMSEKKMKMHTNYVCSNIPVRCLLVHHTGSE